METNTLRMNLQKLSLMMLFAILVLVGCNKDQMTEAEPADEFLAELIYSLETAEEIEEPEEDITVRGYKKRTYSTLRAALKCTGLTGVLRDRSKTLFAPDDEAFAKLGLDADNICDAFDTDALVNILTYHVVDERIPVIRPGGVEMLNGNYANITSQPRTLRGAYYKRYLINGNRLVTRNFCRGIKLFGITGVLLPPSANIVETAIAASDKFSILVQAVLAADPGVLEALGAEGANVTVMAPTDQAFADLLGVLGVSTLEEVVGAVGVQGLTKVLQYHVVPAVVFSSDLTDGLEAPTLQGETFTVDLKNLQLIDKTETPAGLVADCLNIIATNGVIHTIDKVILPQEVLDAL